jgi:hypothetical protein
MFGRNIMCGNYCEFCGGEVEHGEICECDKGQLAFAKDINREVFAHSDRLAKQRTALADEMCELLMNSTVVCKHCGQSHNGADECDCDKARTEAIAQENEAQQAKNRETMRRIAELEAELRKLKGAV